MKSSEFNGNRNSGAPLTPDELNKRRFANNIHRNIQNGLDRQQNAPRNIPVNRINPDYSGQQNYNNGNPQSYMNRNVRPNQNGYPQGWIQVNNSGYGNYPQQNYHQPQNYVQQQPVEPPMPAAKPPKKKEKHRFLKSLLSLILIFSLLAGAVFGYAYSLCSKTTYIESESRFVSSDVMSRGDIYNVLLIGADKESGGVSRSDTMMLLSIDRKNQKLKMTSFLRDMWVDIPEHGSAKLNAAFAYGGTDLLMQTLENNFKVKIDNYIMVNFDMFKALIDGLGGVEVEITKKEADFINRTSHAKVTEGMNKLDGDYALIYCRIRKLDSDFMRTQRQRKVMNAIFGKIKEEGIFKSADAAKSVLPYITTDIPAFELTLKAFGAIKYITFEPDQCRLPIDGAYIDKHINGQAALVPDFDKNIEAVQEFIYE